MSWIALLYAGAASLAADLWRCAVIFAIVMVTLRLGIARKTLYFVAIPALFLTLLAVSGIDSSALRAIKLAATSP